MEEMSHFKENLASSDNLSSKHSFITEPLPETYQALQDCLNDYFSFIGEDLWCNQDIISFLDNCNQQSLMSRLHTEALATQVCLPFLFLFHVVK